jgi:uncharacterized membrane protein (DUF485 family)
MGLKAIQRVNNTRKSFGGPGENRTPTSLRTLDFESRAGSKVSQKRKTKNSFKKLNINSPASQNHNKIQWFIKLFKASPLFNFVPHFIVSFWTTVLVHNGLYLAVLAILMTKMMTGVRRNRASFHTNRILKSHGLFQNGIGAL